MKMNKEQFLKTEFGGELESTITAWDDALSRNREDKEVLRTLAWCQAQWEVYRMSRETEGAAQAVLKEAT